MNQPATDTLVVTCVCGWKTSGTESEVIEATQAHGRALHNMEASRQDVLAMAVPADPSGGPAAEADGQDGS